MSETRVVRLKFFGGFRRLFENQKAELTLTLPADIQLISELRQELEQKLSREGGLLLGESVFADASQVLREHEILGDRTELAVLPPVCGG